MSNILYISNACSISEYESLFQGMTVQINHQSQKFNRLFAEGISGNDVNITMISSRPVNFSLHPRKWYKKKIEVKNGVKYIYLPFFNLKYVRQFFIYVSLKKEVKRWLKSNPDGIVLCDILNYSLLSAVYRMKNKIKLVGIVTDLPEILSDGIVTDRIKKQNDMIANCDGLILLAETMNEKINPNNKPYIVMEGFCDVKMRDVKNVIEDKNPKKVVMYSGLIHKKYGIKNLTIAFMQANIEDSELHIYGVGDYENELKSMTEVDEKVKYFGTRSNEYIVREQMKATLLVNPRPTNEEFVKYSFPSKNMEYLASGTPMLTTKLPSMPSEYEAHCFVCKGYDEENLQNSLTEILAMPKEVLYSKGAEAKEWVLANKNNIAQAKKVIDFVEAL